MKLVHLRESINTCDFLSLHCCYCFLLSFLFILFDGLYFSFVLLAVMLLMCVTAVICNKSNMVIPVKVNLYDTIKF